MRISSFSGSVTKLFLVAGLAAMLGRPCQAGVRLGPELENADEAQKAAYLQNEIELSQREKVRVGAERYALRQQYRNNLIEAMHARAEQQTSSTSVIADASTPIARPEEAHPWWVAGVIMIMAGGAALLVLRKRRDSQNAEQTTFDFSQS